MHADGSTFMSNGSKTKVMFDILFMLITWQVGILRTGLSFTENNYRLVFYLPDKE